MKKPNFNTLHLFKKLNKVFAPPPDLTISEWADMNRILSQEDSAEPGQWRTDRAPYQREMMDSISDPEIENIVFMTSAQIGKTAMLGNVIGYYIDYDPAPMMLVMPTDTMVESFSKDRLSPMIRDCPTLTGKVKDPKSRDSGNTILHKRFIGGHITMTGANSPSRLASRPIRVLLCDEIDRFPPSAGTEGDPLNLAKKRTTTFHNNCLLYTSPSPRD